MRLSNVLYLIHILVFTAVSLLAAFGLVVTTAWLLGIMIIVVREFARAAYQVVKEFLK